MTCLLRDLQFTNCTPLHNLLAASVPEMVAAVVTELLVDGTQKTGRPMYVLCPSIM